PKRLTIGSKPVRPRRPDSNQTASEKPGAVQFSRNVIQTAPYTLHAVLTDNGVQFTDRCSD
ncbi:hypothetical protein XarbCFBP7409_18970, partial [Xanthomonas arboricola pv. guizotiae]